MRGGILHARYSRFNLLSSTFKVCQVWKQKLWSFRDTMTNLKIRLAIMLIIILLLLSALWYGALILDWRLLKTSTRTVLVSYDLKTATCFRWDLRVVCLTPSVAPARHHFLKNLEGNELDFCSLLSLFLPWRIYCDPYLARTKCVQDQSSKKNESNECIQPKFIHRQ